MFSKLIILIVISSVSKSLCQENDIVDELLSRYNDVSSECFDKQNKSQPLYECSGILIRGIKFYNNETKFAWSLKPDDKLKNSFSFGYLRNDHMFQYLGKGYDAGFIVFPHLKTPTQKNKQKALCTYPIDARTDLRNDRGCGLFFNDTTGLSRQCDIQNITTLIDWIDHFNELLDDWDNGKSQFEVRQCGFDMTKNDVRNFDLAMEANAYIQITNDSRLAFVNSEIRFEGWDENNVKQIPIESFFYFIDSKNGRENAKKFRDDFYKQSDGEKVPIVGIRLPTPSNPDIFIEAA